MAEVLFDLPTEKIMDDGTVVLKYAGCIELQMQNKDYHKHLVQLDTDVLKYNRRSPNPLTIYTGQCIGYTKEWAIPEEYQDFDVKGYCLSAVTGQTYVDRVCLEYDEFDKRGMVPMLKFMKFFMDVVREKDILIGVGRGSSCASLLLYLLGVNRIDPVEHDIALGEFLR